MENYSELSLLEVAVKIVEEKNAPINIYELIQEVLNRKGLEDDEKKSLAARLYVDITTSSKFVYMGEDNWDLKLNQPLEQFEKDGSAFNTADYVDEDDEDEDIDDYEDSLSLDEEDEESDEDDEESTEDEDEDEDEFDDDREDDEEYDEDDLEDDDLDSDDDFKEDKYNKYMDDYEDMYEDN
jgi:DNA-directed RNA polymerase subunit delta